MSAWEPPDEVPQSATGTTPRPMPPGPSVSGGPTVPVSPGEQWSRPTMPSSPPARPLGRAVVFGVLAAMILAGIGGYTVTTAVRDDGDARSQPSVVAPTGPDRSSSDPDAARLRRLGVQQQDVGVERAVVIIPEGTDHVTGTTLDLCDAEYPSESLRTARLQVAQIDRNEEIDLSTEAVLYRNPAALDQAFAELRRARAECTTIDYLPAPDGDWADANGVERLAYEFETESPTTGERTVAASVYLRRGRVLLGIYIPDARRAQPAVAGRTTVRGIVELMQERLAALPAEVVNRGG